MATLWSILALALFAPDGSPADQPKTPASPFTITVKITEPCCQPGPEACDDAQEPDTCGRRDKGGALSHELWPMTLSEAIRIALDNSEFIRVVQTGKPLEAQACPMAEIADADVSAAPIVIAAVKSGDDSGPFKAKAMALVRSVEQQYWNLYAAHVHVYRAEHGLTTAEEVIREQTFDPTSPDSVFDVAGALLRLEWLSADVTRGASSVAEHEQRLRAIMGLPQSDNRRIVPCTDPTTNWIAVGAEPGAEERESRQADPHAQRRASDGRDERHGFTGATDPRSQRRIQGLSEGRQGGQRVRQAAWCPQPRYQKGRIPAGEYLDSVRQYAADATAEAGFVAAYNTTLAAICEKSGTLLEYHDIVIAEGPQPPDTLHAATPKRDDEAAKTSFEKLPATAAEVPQIEALPDLDKKVSSDVVKVRANGKQSEDGPFLDLPRRLRLRAERRR